jgi:hypothetical protein
MVDRKVAFGGGAAVLCGLAAAASLVRSRCVCVCVCDFSVSLSVSVAVSVYEISTKYSYDTAS